MHRALWQARAFGCPTSPGSCLPDLRFGFRVPAGSGSKLMDTRTPRLRHPWMPQLRAHGKAAVLLRADWARRNPKLLFRLSGSLLFRLAERTFLGLLFHDPPRRDRRSLWAAPPDKDRIPKDHAPQAFCFGMAGVADPALHGRVEVLSVHPPLGVGFGKTAQLAGKTVVVVVAQAPPKRKHMIAQEIDPHCNGRDL